LFEGVCVQGGEDSLLALRDFLSRVFLNRIERDPSEGGYVLSGVLGSCATVVFSEGDIEGPVQGVLDAPMSPDGPAEVLGVEG